MTTAFTIKFDDRHYAEAVDRRQLVIKSTDGKRIGLQNAKLKQQVAYSHLQGLASLLSNFGIASKRNQRPFHLAEELLKTRLSEIESSHMGENAPMKVSLCHGSFLLEYLPFTQQGAGKQWVLTNPSQTIPRLPGGGNIVGYFASPFWAMWRAVEMTVLSQRIAIAYSELDQNVLDIAKALTTGIQLTTPDASH